VHVVGTCRVAVRKVVWAHGGPPEQAAPNARPGAVEVLSGRPAAAVLSGRQAAAVPDGEEAEAPAWRRAREPPFFARLFARTR
jgi:hypothetical protein